MGHDQYAMPGMSTFGECATAALTPTDPTRVGQRVFSSSEVRVSRKDISSSKSWFRSLVASRSPYEPFDTSPGMGPPSSATSGLRRVRTVDACGFSQSMAHRRDFLSTVYTMRKHHGNRAKQTGVSNPHSLLFPHLVRSAEGCGTPCNCRPGNEAHCSVLLRM